MNLDKSRLHEKVGPLGRWRKRHLVAPLALVALALPLVFITSAQAVHDTGLFQLDGNAQTSVQSSPNALEDWDLICKAHPSTCTLVNGTPAGSSIADRSTFITDAFDAGSDNIFKGGTDDADLDTWLWKQATPSPNKADLENAFAAQYTCTAALVAAGTCSSTYQGHKLLLFGGDRFANNGDTNIGLWFFRSPVSTSGVNTATNGSCPVQSGCGFTGTHTVGNVSLGGTTPGDLFILSAFTGGGAEPTIKVFEWVGPGSATKNYLGSNGCFTSACTLQPLAIPLTPGFSDNRCGGPAVTGDVACALVNAGEITSPWPFQDQSSKSPANKIEANELYEGGLDLSGLGFGEDCITSVLMNTRSSQAGTSVLQDFALGGFGGCGSSLTTTPSVGAAGVSIGSGSVSSGTDSATLTVTGVSTWSGTLDTYLCGPIATGTCNTNGVKVSSLAVTQSTSQPIVSGSATLTSAGRYCWFGKFISSTTGVPDASDDGSASTPNSECFTVYPVTPTLATHASDAQGHPSSTPIDFGQLVYDTADLSGAATEPGTNGTNTTYPSINANNGAYAGSITFTLKGPDTASPNCTTNATGTGTNPQSVNVDTIMGNKTYGPVSFTPGAPGTYHWLATYTNTGSPNNTSPVTHNAACTDTNEDVIVRQIPTQITTAPFAYPNDSATITSSVAGDNLGANGTVTFRLFEAANSSTALQNCQADDGSGTAAGLLYNESKTVTGGTHSQDFSTANITVSVSSDGTFYWRVTYTPNAGDTAHTGIQSSCVENIVLTFTGDSGPGTALP